jgi:hypothetical protein
MRSLLCLVLYIVPRRLCAEFIVQTTKKKIEKQLKIRKTFCFSSLLLVRSSSLFELVRWGELERVVKERNSLQSEQKKLNWKNGHKRLGGREETRTET